MKRFIIIFILFTVLLTVSCGKQQTDDAELSETADNVNRPTVLIEPMMSGQPSNFSFDTLDNDFTYDSYSEEAYLGTFRDFLIDNETITCEYRETIEFPRVDDYVLEYGYRSEEKDFIVWILKNDPETVIEYYKYDLHENFRMREEKIEEATAYAIEIISDLYGEDVSNYYRDARYTTLPDCVYTVSVSNKEGICPKKIGFCDVIESGDGFDCLIVQVFPKKILDGIQTSYSYEEIMTITEAEIQKRTSGAVVCELVMNEYLYSFKSKCWAMQYNARIEVPDETGTPQEYWVACYLMLDK